MRISPLLSANTIAKHGHVAEVLSPEQSTSADDQGLQFTDRELSGGTLADWDGAGLPEH